MKRLTLLLLVPGILACETKSAATDRALSSDSSLTPRPSVTTDSTPVPGGPGARLNVAISAEHGAYVTDENGRALYQLEEDLPDGGRCLQMCLVIWPPFLSGEGSPTAMDITLASNRLGTVERQKGGVQVSYYGHPVYYYLGDGGRGQTRGHHVEDSWGEWYLVRPGGEETDNRARPGGDDRRGSGPQ